MDETGFYKALAARRCVQGWLDEFEKDADALKRRLPMIPPRERRHAALHLKILITKLVGLRQRLAYFDHRAQMALRAQVPRQTITDAERLRWIKAVLHGTPPVLVSRLADKAPPPAWCSGLQARRINDAHADAALRRITRWASARRRGAAPADPQGRHAQPAGLPR